MKTIKFALLQHKTAWIGFQMFPFDRLNLKWERERSLATIHQSFSSKTNTYNTYNTIGL